MNRIGTEAWISLWKVTCHVLKFAFFAHCLWEAAAQVSDSPSGFVFFRLRWLPRRCAIFEWDQERSWIII